MALIGMFHVKTSSSPSSSVPHRLHESLSADDRAVKRGHRTYRRPRSSRRRDRRRPRAFRAESGRVAAQHVGRHAVHEKRVRSELLSARARPCRRDGSHRGCGGSRRSELRNHQAGPDRRRRPEDSGMPPTLVATRGWPAAAAPARHRAGIPPRGHHHDAAASEHRRIAWAARTRWHGADRDSRHRGDALSIGPEPTIRSRSSRPCPRSRASARTAPANPLASRSSPT